MKATEYRNRVTGSKTTMKQLIARLVTAIRRVKSPCMRRQIETRWYEWTLRASRRQKPTWDADELDLMSLRRASDSPEDGPF